MGEIKVVTVTRKEAAEMIKNLDDHTLLNIDFNDQDEQSAVCDSDAVKKGVK